jgi:uncharacterized SAM-binding protein YcdF (DUF218 family)
MKILLLPPLGLVLLLAGLAMIGAGWHRRFGAGLIAMLLIAGHLPVVADGLTEVPAMLTSAPVAVVPQVIIVPSLGYQDEGSGRGVDALTLERLAKAADLARSTGLPILVSGGRDGVEGPSLGELMAQRLMFQFEVREPWIESRAVNTAENAAFSAEILKPKGISAAYLVTQDWHMARAQMAYAAYGIATAPAAISTGSRNGPPRARWIPSLLAGSRSAWAIHEIVGLIWYRLTLPREGL